MFTILAAQRSGTHLLATLLDSHPELRCYEEVLLRSLAYDERNKELGERHPLLMKEHEGGIVMYNHFVAADEDTKNKIVSGKIIHLTRDMDNILRSLYGIYHKDKFNTQSFYKEEKEIFVPEPPKHWKGKQKKNINEMKERAFERIPDGKNRLEVTYKWLTGGESITELPKEKAKVLCEFLGVKSHKLTTDFRKPKYVRPG